MAGGYPRQVGVMAGELNTHTLDRTESLERLNSAYLPVLYEQLLQAGGGNPLAAQEGLQGWLRGQNIDVTIIRENNTTAFVTHDRTKNQINISFSASDETRDIIDNANFIPTENAMGGHVHQGFDNAANRVMDDVKAAVLGYASAADDKRTDVHLSGFSQGGSAAIITAANWMESGFLEQNPNLRLNSVYTFGSPPSGDAKFIDSFQANAALSDIKLVRVVAEGDPIPGMMTKDGPWWIPEIYDHVKNTFHLDKAGNITAVAGNASFKNAENDWGAHNPLHYMEQLNSAQNSRSTQSAATEYGINSHLQSGTPSLQDAFAASSNPDTSARPEPAPHQDGPTDPTQNRNRSEPNLTPQP